MCDLCVCIASYLRLFPTSAYRARGRDTINALSWKLVWKISTRWACLDGTSDGLHKGWQIRRESDVTNAIYLRSIVRSWSSSSSYFYVGVSPLAWKKKSTTPHPSSHQARSFTMPDLSPHQATHHASSHHARATHQARAFVTPRESWLSSML